MRMKSMTFAVSKGGVGKSLLTANVGAALAKMGNNVVLVEGDPNRPLQTILEVDVPSAGLKLDDVVQKDVGIQRAVYATRIESLSLIPSGISFSKISPSLS